MIEPELLAKAQTALSERESLDQTLLSTQLKSTRKRLTQVNAERRRLLDMYQGGFIEKDEFETRASQATQRITELQSDLESLEQECQRAGATQSLTTRLKAFTSTITHKLDTMDFHERQMLLRSVLEEVVINNNHVKLYLKIPLPKPKPQPVGTSKLTTNPAVSTQFDLRSRSVSGWGLSHDR